MKTKLALASTALLAGCTTASYYQPSSPSSSYTPAPRTSNSTATGYRPTPNMSVDSYKRLVAKQITAANPDKVYPGNPQAMLRSVVVLKYVVDSNGRLVRSDTLRSNGDSATVATAMSALRKAAPFPPPPANLLDHGRMEILETALFNDDGRFQLRSVALPQSD
jgi:protein TonB